MLILLTFAFLAGLVTVLSPCILPILAPLLSSTTLKGKWRPLAMILGLILSFSLFTLTLSIFVRATGISANIFRNFAILVILLFGLVMVFPKLSDWFAKLTTPLANLGERFSKTDSESGFASGFIFGIALGLLFTPCAGPILASVTVLAATQSITSHIVLIILAYSVGAGIPLFLIAYGGSKIFQSSKFLRRHTEGIRKGFGILMILTALALALHLDMPFQVEAARVLPTILIEDNDLVKEQLEKLRQKNNQAAGNSLSKVIPGEISFYGKAPEFQGIVNWINSPPLSMMQLQGKVVLIDFWTYSCINCLRTLPYLKKWYADYKDKGLVIVGVHTPEFAFEKEAQNVIDAAHRLSVTYPIAQDNDYKTWEAYRNRYWPAHYLIDKAGDVRLVHFGEGKYVETENAIRHLLGLPALAIKEPETSRRPITPETYLGTSRASGYNSEIDIKPNQVADYNYQKALANDEMGLKGKWKIEAERITSASNESYLDLNFLARKVYLVLSGSSATPLQVILDGKATGEILVDSDRKYDIANTTYGRHLLSLKIPKGVSAYAFTFGDE